MQDPAGFQFAIRPIQGGGWVWETWERGSDVRADGGVVRTKAEAAALVVRAIARGMTDDAGLHAHAA